MAGLTLIQQAAAFAADEHVFNQPIPHKRRYGLLPYTHHLQAVVLILIRFGYSDPVMQACGWLHDIKEDCAVKTKHLIERFGEEVDYIVEGVTNEPGINRAQKWLLTAPKIRGCEKRTAVKLADRISHFEAGGNLLRMYVKEHPDFVRGIYVPGVCEPMWEYLNSLVADVSANSRK